MSHRFFLHMKSFSGLLCLLHSFCSVFNAPACINDSWSPQRPLIYEFYPGLSLPPPEGSIDGPICRVCHHENRPLSANIMNILLTTSGLQHLRFRWYRMIQEILSDFILLGEYYYIFLCWGLPIKVMFFLRECFHSWHWHCFLAYPWSHATVGRADFYFPVQSPIK